MRREGIQSIPSNVFCIGKQDWGKWLYLVKNCDGVWVYYSRSDNHYVSHISPNKYWESVLFNKTMFVNQISQFSDRISLEAPFIEIGENPEETLIKVLNMFDNLQKEELETSERLEKFEAISNSRSIAAAQILSWVFE
jgi:hypothetical protein